MVLCGGITGQDEAATPEIQSLVEQVKEAVHSNLNASFQVFQAVSFRTQVVAGRNYFVKVHVGDDKCIHVRIFKSLQQDVSLHSVQADKTMQEPVAYF